MWCPAILYAMGERLDFLHSFVLSPDCTMALASRQYCVAPVVLQRIPYSLARPGVGFSGNNRAASRMPDIRNNFLYAAGLRRGCLTLGDLRFLLTAALPFKRCVRLGRTRWRFIGAAVLAVSRTLVLTFSGSAARFSVSSWVALVSVPAA